METLKTRALKPVIVLLASLTAVGTVAVGGPNPAPARAATKDGPPNVLIIVTDDQPVGTLGAEPKVREYFKQGGTTFTRAYATTPTCCPSRASIFSGRYAHNHGVTVTENPQLDTFNQSATIQRYLDDAGYRTGIVGKYFNDWDIYSQPPHFDEWSIYSSNDGSRMYSGNVWNVRGDVGTVWDYSTMFIKRQALRFLGGASDDPSPWFLYVAVPAPHQPAKPEPLYAKASVGPFKPGPAFREKDRTDKPPYVQKRHVTWADSAETRARQMRTLMSVDDMVAALFRRLKSTGQLDNTLAFYISDNGYLYGDHGLRAKAHSYDRSVRVPLMARWPGHFAKGVKDRRLVGNIDLAPTILQALSITPEVPMDGRSLLDPTARERLLLEYWPNDGKEVPPWASTITTTSQYTEYFADATRSLVSFREYYDLIEDPWQLRNELADSNPGNDKNATKHQAQLAQDVFCAGTEGPTACP